MVGVTVECCPGYEMPLVSPLSSRDDEGTKPQGWRETGRSTRSSRLFVRSGAPRPSRESGGIVASRDARLEFSVELGSYLVRCARTIRSLDGVSAIAVRSAAGAKSRNSPARLTGFWKSWTWGGVSQILGMTHARPASKDLRTLPMIMRSAPSSASSSSRSANLTKPCGMADSSVFQGVAVSTNRDRLPGRAGVAARAKGRVCFGNWIRFPIPSPKTHFAQWALKFPRSRGGGINPAGGVRRASLSSRPAMTVSIA